MKNRIISIGSLIVLAGLVFWYFSAPERRAGFMDRVSTMGLMEFLLITLGTFGFILFQGFVLKHSVKPYGVHLKFTEHFGIIIVTFFSNYLIPFLGFGVRGVYLKHKHGLAYRDFSQSLIAVLVIEWAMFALIAVIAASVLISTGQPVSYLLILLMAGILCGFVFLFAVKPHWVPRFLPLSGLARSVLTDWQNYTANRSSMLLVALYTFLGAVCFAFVFIITYGTLFPQVPAAASVFAACLSDLALIIRILPAAAGSLEGALQLAMMPYGLSFEDNISVALIVRAALAVVFVPFGPFFFWWLLIQSGVKNKAQEDKA